MESNSNDTLISSEDEINNLVNDVLKKLKNLKYLRLSAKGGTSLENLSEITFLKGVEESNPSDNIDLIELDTLGTRISTRKSESGETYENGLMLLGKKQEGEINIFYYCPSLSYLVINEPKTKLSDINDRIVYLLEMEGSGCSYFYGNYYGHFRTDNSSVLSSLSECTGLSKIIYRGGCDTNVKLDFSSSSLTYLSLGWGNYACDIKLPDSCKTVQLEGYSGDLNLENLDNFSLATNGTNSENLKKLLKSVGSDKCISSLSFRVQVLGDNNLEFFREVLQERKSELSVKNLSCQTNNQVLSNFKSLDGIDGICGLEIVSFQSNCFPNLTDIDALSSQSNTLKRISIEGASIAHCGVFANLDNITYVNLQNNSISDYYTDEETGETIYNIKVICEAVKKGCANEAKTTGKEVTGTLKLKGNNGVTDWNPYLSETWSNDSNYGRKDT